MTEANKPKNLVEHDAANNLRHIGDKLAAALKRNIDYEVEHGKLKARIAELEAILAAPVKLPILFSLAIAGNKSTRSNFKWHNDAIKDCEKAIRAAGFTVAGDNDES